MPNHDPKRSVSKQFILGFMANFSCLAPSMSLGFSAVAIPFLAAESNPIALNASQITWFASIASLATPFGSLCSGSVADKYGRRSAFFGINFAAFIGWLLIAAAFYIPEHQFPLLIIGRIFTGFSTGFCSSPPSLYMAEVSSPGLRGVFTTWSSISFSLGILLVYFLGFILKEQWGVIAFVTAIFPCISMFFCVFFIPESPSWLVTKHRYEEAQDNMRKIFGFKEQTPTTRSELQALVTSKEKSDPLLTSQSDIRSIVMLLLEPKCYRPMMIIGGYFFFQQFAGTFAVIFYAISIVKEADITFDPYATIVAIAFTRFLAGIGVSFVSKKYGRRPLSLISGVGISISMISLASYVYWYEKNKVESQYLMYIPVVCLVMYFLTGTIGFSTLPFAMNAEVFPLRIRGTATGLTTCLAYSFTFITVKYYLNMVDLLGRCGLFYFYGVVALFGTVFIYFYLPETRGKTLHEIEEYFEGKSKKQNVQCNA